MKSVSSPKHRFQQALRATALLHERGAGGIRVALRLTSILDEQIGETYARFLHPAKSSLVLIALGGYGRKELCFGSDTDIMFLLPERDMAEASFAAQKLLHEFLDLGMDIGHSVRTVNDCLALKETDFEAWVSLVECRFLCGDRQLFQEFRSRLQRQINEGDSASVVRELMKRSEARHEKYGTSARLLEPNIKNSAGGLRDLHSIVWHSLASGCISIPAAVPARETTVTHILKSAFWKRLLSPQVRKAALDAFDFLLRVRNAMHLQSKGLHDSLEFTFQRTVAGSLNVVPSKTRSSVERFMQEYFVSARTVARCARTAVGFIEQKVLPAPQDRPVPLDDLFALREGRIVLRRKKPLTNVDILKAALLRLHHHAPFSEQLLDVISRRLKARGPLKTREECRLFRQLLSEPNNVALVLRELNELGILGQWIPEWKELIAFFQHNQYHYFTADEHTLRALGNAEALANEQSSFGEAFRRLPKRETLSLACLLHDIGKPKRVGNHEVTGASMARTILRRLRCQDIAANVEFLVRHHLLMEQVAFRRNLNDPQTIIDFAAKFPTAELLDYLYVLTYADLSAVNKSVWTDWKAMLLYELYKKSREVIERKMTSEQVFDAARIRHSEAVKDLVASLSDAVSPESSRLHLEAVDSPAYLATFDPKEIAEHIRHIERNEPVATIFRNQGDVTEVTIIARDAPFALSRFCGVLSANDANIIDANIFTRNDGIIIDKFRVTDFLSRTALGEEQRRKIHSELNDVMTGRVRIEQLLERHQMKWRRLRQGDHSSARTAVEFEEHPQYTIVDVFAPDRLGFLYKITETISSLGYSISFAKIATRADGIVDSFYLLDSEGTAVKDEKKKKILQNALLQTIRQVSGSELVPA